MSMIILYAIVGIIYMLQHDEKSKAMAFTFLKADWFAKKFNIKEEIVSVIFVTLLLLIFMSLWPIIYLMTITGLIKRLI